MASSSTMISFEEGRSIMCPPLFKGEGYFQWSNIMKYFIQGFNLDIWMIIKDGHLEAPKKKKKMSVKDTKKDHLNAKAIHILLCALSEEISKKISPSKSAKEIWEKLEKLYGKEEKKDDASSCAILLSTPKVDGVMALDEPKVSSNSNDPNAYSFDELQDAFNELYLEFETMNSKFKKMISKLEFENDFLLKTKLDFEKGNEILKNDLEFSKTSNGILEKENLDLKVKLESLAKEKEIIFNTSSHPIMTKCSHCHYHDHSLHTCPIKKKKSYKIRQVWFPKGTRDIEINVNGSKAIWIPKSK
ncbi:hypothetical protein HRI_001484100 [Hibiscus trionum]|uniref:DUF4219 domain-containing protein n=1 Tax=Hibiscus trionum TaxID=183268 RepID=A0A9W7HIL6_HIBTR|nr:hypothetical protein HRI_001484100 [Hibiscus trionum]